MTSTCRYRMHASTHTLSLFNRLLGAWACSGKSSSLFPSRMLNSNSLPRPLTDPCLPRPLTDPCCRVTHRTPSFGISSRLVIAQRSCPPSHPSAQPARSFSPFPPSLVRTPTAWGCIHTYVHTYTCNVRTMTGWVASRPGLHKRLY